MNKLSFYGGGGLIQHNCWLLPRNLGNTDNEESIRLAELCEAKDLPTTAYLREAQLTELCTLKTGAISGAALAARHVRDSTS